jgi:Transposase IS66 family
VLGSLRAPGCSQARRLHHDNRAAQASVRELIWKFYRDLKAYRSAPTKHRKAALRARFDRIFTRKTGFVTLDRLLARLNANKPELLMVLNRPEIPLHTNGSENDIRCQVTRRKVSAGTRSDIGRNCRDAFLALAKTCAKLEIAFWDYLGDRFTVPAKPFRPRPKSSSPEHVHPDRHDFCPSYQFCSYVFDTLSGCLASQAAYEGSIPFARSMF